MPEIIIETSSTEKDIIGIDGEIYHPSAEMETFNNFDSSIYESKGKKS